MKNVIPEIRQISTSETLLIRHKVMWPNRSIAYVELPNDENGRHFGLFINGKIASVISVFVKNDEAQFRKFATLIEFQGLGYGSFLLKNIIALLRKEGVRKLWCNARIGKTEFYEKFNLKPTNKKFKKGGIDYVIMEKIFSDFS